MEENQADNGQSLSVLFLKESQFYLACKLVAIYQDHLLAGKRIEDLKQEKINKEIVTGRKYFAQFDLTALSQPKPDFKQEEVQELSEEDLDADSYINPQEQLELRKSQAIHKKNYEENGMFETAIEANSQAAT